MFGRRFGLRILPGRCDNDGTIRNGYPNFVVNNGGVYHGNSADSDAWLRLQQNTIEGNLKEGLKSSSLGWEVGYEKIAEICGGEGYLVRTPAELARATEEGFIQRILWW